MRTPWLSWRHGPFSCAPTSCHLPVRTLSLWAAHIAKPRCLCSPSPGAPDAPTWAPRPPKTSSPGAFGRQPSGWRRSAPTQAIGPASRVVRFFTQKALSGQTRREHVFLVSLPPQTPFPHHASHPARVKSPHWEGKAATQCLVGHLTVYGAEVHHIERTVRGGRT